MMSEISARLCILRKWEDFQGYGFNLHGEKNKTGHFIGIVEENSPAQSSGLCKGDRVIEINGTNVTNRSHNDVVSLIRNAGPQVEMLVMTEEMENAALSEGVVVTSSSSCVSRIESANSKAEYVSVRTETTEAIVENTSDRSEEEQRKYEEEIAESVAVAAMASESNHEAEEEEKPAQPESLPSYEEPSATPEPQPEPEPLPVEPEQPAAAAPTSNGASQPQMTAAEFRAQLKAKKKSDPRQGGSSFRDKTLMFQQM